MAQRECLIIILDVREAVRKDFRQKCIKCVAEILKNKICSAKKDYVSFVLLGTENTDNELHNEQGDESYLNIVQYPHIQLANWQLLINFYKFVNEPATNKGQWLDAIVVAMEMLKSAEQLFKCQQLRIVLFQDFMQSTENNFSMFDVVTKTLLESEINLIVVSSEIAYVDNAEDATKIQSVFKHDKTHSQNSLQMGNEEHALRLVSHCNAQLCNFNEALSAIFKVQNKRPWCWNCNLSIGTCINIAISGIIAIKNESSIKLKRCWGEVNEEVRREKKYYMRGTEVHPLPEELINGYMLGGTPVEYDKQADEDEERLTPGLKFIAFTQANLVPDEYFFGDSLYLIVHQRGRTGSAKKLEALVKAMHNTKVVMLCWKIFSVKFNMPKLVVLLPNELVEGEPATLSMVELTYHAQHHFWDFPKLRTKKTECSEEQMQAINNLIDSMDLTISDKLAHEPRASKQRDLLPFDALPHIHEQNILDILERKIIFNAGENDEQFQKMLMDKNFVEIYWKVPEPIEEEAKRAAKKVKQLFPLQRAKPVLKARVGAAVKQKISESQAELQAIASESELDFDAVRIENPATDFQRLLDHHVAPLRNTTQRDVQFNIYAKQLRDIIWQQLFEQKPPLQTEQIYGCMDIYRLNCHVYGAFDDYNTWIRAIKAEILKLQKPYLIEFFKDVIVGNDLGLCTFGDLLLDEKIAQEEFYTLED